VIKSENETISISQFAEGTYFLRIEDLPKIAAIIKI
jgi:hypothetical protein